MHIGASAAFESPNIASRSAEEWISAETSRAEAAPAPDETDEASSSLTSAPPATAAAGASVAAGAAASDFFDEAPMPWLKDSISSSRSSPDSSSTGAYEPVSSWRARSSAEWMPMYDRVSKSR